MILLVDSREGQRIKWAQEYCKKNEIVCSVSQLETGDFVFTENKTVGFEYKRIDDLISSIAKGKIFRQISNMDYNHNFVFISGFKDLQRAISRHNRFSKNTIHISGVYSAIARLNTLCNGVIYFDCNTFRQELALMHDQAQKCFVAKPYNAVSDKKKTSNPAVNYLSCVNGVSLQKAELICDTYNIGCLIDLFGLTSGLLTSIDGIGDKTAVKILEAVGGEM